MDKVLRFRCDDELKALVDAHCTEIGHDFSKWMRWLILNEIHGYRRQWGREEIFPLSESENKEAA